MEQQLLLLYSVGVCGQLIRLFNNLYFSRIFRENMSDDLEESLKIIFEMNMNIDINTSLLMYVIKLIQQSAKHLNGQTAWS